MPINPDGTFSDGTNFTQTGYNNAPPGSPIGVGTSDDGTMVWNPTGGPDGKGAYERPNGHNTATSAAGNGRSPSRMGPGGWSNGTGNPINGYGNNDATTTGKAMGFDGKSTTAGAWGGYAGTYVQGPDGSIVYDAGQNGRQEAVDRARGLGAAAANRPAVQIDYGQANGFAGMGATDRGTQLDALGLTQQTANGQNLQSMKLGQQMLQQGVQAQQAAAASTRGGSLGAAAARMQQQNGQGAFLAQGQTQLDAQRANEMAAGRDAYMQQSSALRSSDATAQGLTQQQQISQQNQELGQRQLNQQGQMGYEAQGQAVNNAAADAALKNDEIDHGIDAAASLRSQQQANRQMQTVAAGVGAGGALAAGAGGVIFGDGNTNDQQQSSDDGMDPYSRQVSHSDARSKTNIRGLGYYAATRRGDY